jgi:hypothetical protein
VLYSSSDCENVEPGLQLQEGCGAVSRFDLVGGVLCFGSAGDCRCADRASSCSGRSPRTRSDPQRPRYSQTTVESYARSIDCSRYIMKTIPIYYRLAPRRNIAPEVLVAQAIVETGRGYYGGDSKPWNMAGIKKGGAVGDGPKDFEVPPTAYQGVRMHVNHMAAYTGKKPIGKPHDRFHDARAAQKQRGWWVRRISQLGDGIWATDSTYASKIQNHLDNMVDAS